MLPVGNESSRTSLSSVGAAFLTFWTVLTLVGLLLYLALWVLDLRKFAGLEVGAIACVTAALAVLLAVDKGSNDSQVDVANMMLAGCVYLLLTKHMIALGITVFAIAGGVAGAYYIISSLASVEYQGLAGTLVVKLPGQTVYYLPLQPYGWENTQIKLKDKQTFQVEITGHVSPGLGLEIARISAAWQKTWRGESKGQELELPDWVLWDFSGPEGYSDDFYARLYKERIKDIPDHPDIQHYDHDKLLTVRGRPHNEVIGVIVAEDEQACPKRPSPKRLSKDKDPPCTGTDVKDEPGYDAKDDADKDKLYFLAAERDKYPLEREARKSGTLWLTINDADLYRYDNVGLFFVKVTIRRW
jgi:hypothetical protein